MFRFWTRTRVQTIEVRGGSVGADAAFARLARTRARLGLWASRYTLTAFVHKQVASAELRS
jgi:hypothetical protein